MISLTGFNLAFGIEFWGTRVGNHWVGIILLLITIAGIGLSFLKNENKPKILAIISVIGLLLLLGLAFGINNMISREFGDFGAFINIKMGAGYYLMFLTFLLAGALNFYFIKTGRTES